MPRGNFVGFGTTVPFGSRPLRLSGVQPLIGGCWEGLRQPDCQQSSTDTAQHTQQAATVRDPLMGSAAASWAVALGRCTAGWLRQEWYAGVIRE